MNAWRIDARAHPFGVAIPRAFSSAAMARADLPANSASTGRSASALALASSRFWTPLALRPPSFTPCAFLAASASLLRWDGGAGCKVGFPPASGKEKPRLAFRAAAIVHLLSAREFQGSTRKNLTRIDWMKGAPVTDQRYALQSRSTVLPIGCDALP
jgi:hypothetical protein